MMLARYGGGVGVKQIRDILKLPLTTVVRLMGSALVANGGKREPGANADPNSDADIVRQLEEKARKAGANI